ncbi:MAG: alpha/beta hydrolase family esterase [Mycobacterium sp.]
MRIVFAALWVLLLMVPGCARVGATPGFATGTTVHTLSFGGVDRSFRVYVPAELDASAPLVVVLHGGFGSAQQAQRAYGWDQLADSAKLVVAYPDGLNRAWNSGGGCCGRSARDGVDDVGFISAVIDAIGAGIGVDQERVYATGISNGGMMSYALACNTDRFAAIGPDSATQLATCETPSPTSVLHIHGTADELIRYDGEPGTGVARIDGPPIPEVNSFWRTVDRCSEPVTTADGAVSTSNAACADGREVVLMTVDGGGHEWPSFATGAIWDFFAAH